MIATLLLASTLSVLAAAACHPPIVSAHSSSLRVTHVNAASYVGNAGDSLEQACDMWRLNPDQVAQFFQLSQEYAQDPYNQFYQVPCSISGELESGDKVWRFQINGGATATWTSENAERHWGCSAKACEPLVLLPTDGMSGDSD